MSGTFMVKNVEKILLEGASGMSFVSFQTSSSLWCKFPLSIISIIKIIKITKIIKILMIIKIIMICKIIKILKICQSVISHLFQEWHPIENLQIIFIKTSAVSHLLLFITCFGWGLFLSSSHEFGTGSGRTK